jgi:hypothetical protein
LKVTGRVPKRFERWSLARSPPKCGDRIMRNVCRSPNLSTFKEGSKEVCASVGLAVQLPTQREAEHLASP